MNHQHAIREEELKNRVASGAFVPIFGDAELAYLDGKMGNYSHYGSTSHTNFVSVQRCNMRGATWDGNSGSPIFLVVGDELVMLFAKHTGTRGNVTWASFYGPMVTFHLDAIQSQIDVWEGDNAGLYQLNILDLSDFAGIVNKE